MKRRRTSGPDYYLLVSVHVPGRTITGIKCKVYLDYAAAHRSRVLLLPDDHGVGRLVGALRSVGLIGHFPSYVGPSTSYLRIPKFIIRGVKNQHWGPALSETRVTGYPSALIRTTKLTSAPRAKAHVVVWLHGGRLLGPSGIQERSYTGVIRLVRKWRCRARLGPQALIVFDEHTAFPKGGPPEGIAQLVLRTDLPSPLSGPEITLRRYEAELEDVLTLASIAARERISWHRIQASDGRVLVDYWGTERRPPAPRSRRMEPLIERYTIPAFLEQTYSALVTSPARSQLVDAGYALAPHYHQPFESEYLSTFSRLEALVIALRRGPQGPQLLGPQPWANLRKALQKTLKGWGHQQRVLTRAERKAMYAKLTELNRPPFGEVWQEHIAVTGIPVHDLWPLQASDGFLDLLDIRNRLAHGRAMPSAGVAPLLYALYHLRWTLERVVLQTLGYPLKGTDASYEHVFARYQVTQQSLQSDRAAITTVWG